MKKFLNSFLLMVFFLAPAVFAVDTLEVYAMRVQFAKESPDNSLTTGLGHFDSDSTHKKDYKLDPTGRRGTASYWKKHFDFANSYFKAASHGNLVIKYRIFPEGGSSAYELKKQIIDYNRTSKQKGEKTAEFDEARSRDYLQFIYDAVMASHKPGDSPFEIPLPENSNTKRAYMIIHAGASRLVDGGGMGPNHADSPADFMDVYIEGTNWQYLPDSLEYISTVSDTVSMKGGKDSIRAVGTGIVLKDAAIDTLKAIMVLSETASQDGLNWGVNGILVNQIAKSLGLPDTYDTYKGISRLGYFDLMDFAGYNAGNGFLPAMPAAWERAYMGWSKVKEVRPTAGKPVTVDVVAAGSSEDGVEIVKVPLNASEYLLIENRQRSWNEDGTVSVTTSDPDESEDRDVRTVDVDSLHLVFEDSTRDSKGKRILNKSKASGIIVDASSFDAGIPASGIVVWKVNEWYLREGIPFGVANVWGGDTLRDHQFGISLVESDGVLSIGKTFKNALGEDTYDYGSGTDLLPHQRIADSSSSKKYGLVDYIGATGYANTMTTQGGYTGIKISVDVPKNARKEKTANAFLGDSVVNYGALKLTVTISIDDGSIAGSQYPREIGLNTAIRGAVFVENPEQENEKIVVIGAENGTLQAFSALGDTLYDADTVVKKIELTSNSQEKDVPLYRVASSFGNLKGLVSDGKYVYSLHDGKLARTKFDAGLPLQETLNLPKGDAASLMLVNDKLWFGVGMNVYSVSVATFDKVVKEFSTAAGNVADMVYCGSGEGVYGLAVASDDGHVIAYDTKENSIGVNVKDPVVRLACTDLDRDGIAEIVAVGSRGNVVALSRKDGKTLWTKNYKRGAAGTSGLENETSGIALGDINDDGYPEIVFLGDNLVYALDRFGLPLAGFPVKITKGSPEYAFFSDPLIVDVTGDDIPEILVPTNGGLVYAFTGKGKPVTDQFPLSAGSYEFVDSLSQVQPMSIFVTDAVSSKVSKGPELFAFHRSSVTALRLQKASEDATQNAAAWTLPAGGNERTGYFDASRLGDVKDVEEKDEISEFFMFPNPVRGGIAQARFEVGAEAKSATLELFDITGLCVFKQKMSDVATGRNQFENLDLTALGSDVYTARLQVKFKSGKTKKKLYRVGVVR